MSNKPSVLLFGGLNTFSRALASLLVPLEGEPLVSHLRIVDKFSVHPPTTYIGSEFPQLLSKPQLEYRQANLTIPSVVSKCFDPVEGKEPFDYVFDFTGELSSDRTEAIFINNTCNVARLLGLEAARRNIKAYIRIHQPFYETPKKAAQDGKDEVKPEGTIGVWWHEALRMLAAVPDLNLVVLRIGFGYGPYTTYGIIASAITVASVYGYMKKPMKSMWPPGKNPTNTIHVDDIAGAALACAEWIALLGRAAANQAAGEQIAFHNEKSKVKEVEGMPAHDEKLIAPVFNVVDDSESTLLSVGGVTTSFFGTNFEFFNLVETTLFKLKDDAVEEINEHHVSAWTEMLLGSKPPIPNTPLTAYMDKYSLDKHSVAYSNKKLKEIVGYKLKKPHLNHDTIKEVVDKWKAENSWPNAE
ncbi:hypothetical protein AMATHDRAFT_63842 [Amanita thiersii Skay4041]|uniref:NAD-dependent epimerase/dehydratase domain-containing protein n=1 Tax=Amanita thiersii Skay4041 TaxID=703135 RepID=A0A2A9NES6_9AGAR|nr:hypothetical protein AMATHDRAFT_63842 [Amanita thiersii Skay4041]